jgi:hypothetical protein
MKRYISTWNNRNTWHVWIIYSPLLRLKSL